MQTACKTTTKIFLNKFLSNFHAIHNKIIRSFFFMNTDKFSQFPTIYLEPMLDLSIKFMKHLTMIKQGKIKIQNIDNFDILK